jgi:putative endonuclease
MVHVYVLRSLETGRRYVGMTDDVARRLDEHRRRRSKSAKILGEFEVLLTESYPTRIEARLRERFLKAGSGRAWLDAKFGAKRRS